MHCAPVKGHAASSLPHAHGKSTDEAFGERVCLSVTSCTALDVSCLSTGTRKSTCSNKHTLSSWQKYTLQSTVRLLTAPPSGSTALMLAVSAGPDSCSAALPGCSLTSAEHHCHL